MPFTAVVWRGGLHGRLAACVGFAGWTWRRLAAVLCSRIYIFILLIVSSLSSILNLKTSPSLSKISVFP